LLKMQNFELRIAHYQKNKLIESKASSRKESPKKPRKALKSS